MLLVAFSLIGGAYFAPAATYAEQKPNLTVTICKLIEYSFII